MDATQMDRRLEWKWYRLIDHTGVARIVTPIEEGIGQGVPGIVRYRDSLGRPGFTEDIWMHGKATRLAPDEVAAALPRLSEHEIDRLFPRPITPASAVGLAARTQRMMPAKHRKKHGHAKSAQRPTVEVKVLHRKVPHAPVA